jgi:hypothetical protein
MSVSMKQLSLLLLIFLFSFASYAQVLPTNFGVKFEYDLKLSVDANKRAAYLKKNNEQPSAYEKVFTVLTGTVQVANVVDDVKFTQNSYQITSIGNLIAGLSTALGGQRLVRESIGAINASGLLSSVYQEKRGNTDLLISRFEPPKKSITFFKASFRNPISSIPFDGQLIDLVNVGYQFIGRPLPTKPITYQVSDARSVKRYTLIPAEVWEFPIDGKKIKAKRFYKTTSKDDTNTFEIWFSEGRNFPIRSVIGLSDQYGATIQIDLKKLPNL